MDVTKNNESFTDLLIGKMQAHQDGWTRGWDSCHSVSALFHSGELQLALVLSWCRLYRISHTNVRMFAPLPTACPCWRVTPSP